MIERETAEAVDADVKVELDRVFLQDGAEALERLKEDGESADLADHHVEALEAIVESDGSRPTLLVSDQDQIDAADEALGSWQPLAKDFAGSISKVAAAVGRIDLGGHHCGTGFVIRDNLILTNRHVLQGLAIETTPGDWSFQGQPTITFDARPEESRARTFKIAPKVVLSGEDAIDLKTIDFNKLDFAVLECEPGPAAFPQPLPLESDKDKIVVERPVYTMGYSGRPRRGQYPFRVLLHLFRHRFGVKRFAPGEIDHGTGTPSEGQGVTVFTHDSTTLGGNSGSCVVDFGNDGMLVVGLHFGGMPGTANYAHSNALLRQALHALDLTWKEWL